MRKRRILVVSLLIFCFISLMLFTACGNSIKSSDSDGVVTFSWWNANGEDSIYYSDYSENPVINYLTEYKTWGPNETKIAFDFHIPPSGTQLDNVVTMIATGDYTDIIDMSYYTRTGSVVELYEDGICMDITGYVEKYMPNYMAFLDKNPSYKITATNYVEGEARYLQIYTYQDSIPEQWGGWQYRRDWIVKYGTNPETGAQFTGGYQVPMDVDTWTDDVVFPSGGTDPVYISDWEWMLDIFSIAHEKEGISDGYGMSISYTGHYTTGDLVSAFGGGSSSWYMDGDTVEFGGNSDDFRVYLQAMNTWYENGWIDEGFAENSSDIFYRIDSTSVHQGKVGLFYEAMGTLGSLLDISEGLPNNPENGYTNGIMVFGASAPINDIYGGHEQQEIKPFTMYQVTQEFSSIIITDKAADKDLEVLFTFLDSLYSTEDENVGLSFGLNKEQYDLTQNELYTKYGLTEGAYEIVETDEGMKYKYVDLLAEDTFIRNALIMNRLNRLNFPSKTFSTNNWVTKAATESWVKYVSTGFFKTSFHSQRTAEETKTYSKIQNNVEEFMSKNIPKFIMDLDDPFSDEQWEAYVNAIGKYKPETNVEIMQGIYDRLN